MLQLSRTMMRISLSHRGAHRAARWLAVLAAMAFVLFVGASAVAQPATAPSNRNDIVSEGVDRDGRVQLTVNKSTVIATRVAYKKVSIGNAGRDDRSLVDGELHAP